MFLEKQEKKQVDDLRPLNIKNPIDESSKTKCVF